MPDAPILDAQVLESLRQALGAADPTFVPEMASLFLSETEGILREIKEAHAGGNLEVVTRLAHGLKSSSATLGLMRISQAARQLEVDGRAADASRVGPSVEALAACFSEARPTIDRLIGVRGQPSSS